MVTAKLKDIISAPVKRPQIPNEILLQPPDQRARRTKKTKHPDIRLVYGAPIYRQGMRAGRLTLMHPTGVQYSGRILPLLPKYFQFACTYLFPDVHGRLKYWHMGRSKKARATVAMTVTIQRIS
jgi:hypothetical protein